MVKSVDKRCVVCGTPFTGHPHRKSCSPACAEIRHKEQLKRHADKRRKGKLSLISCGICKTKFMQTHHKQKYCSAECAHVSLRAIAKQTKLKSKNRGVKQ